MKKKFSYWVEDDMVRGSYAFTHHVLATAQNTGRLPKEDCSSLENCKDGFGRVPITQLTNIVNLANTDSSFTYDCAARIGIVHMSQIAAMMNAAPTLGDALDFLAGIISYLDDRLCPFQYLQKDGDRTCFGFFYNEPVPPHFYHTQAAAILLTCLDAWPQQYLDNSVFNLPHVADNQRTTMRALLHRPWLHIVFRQWPLPTLTIPTEQLKAPSPNFNPEWWDNCQRFLRWGMDSMSQGEQARKPWCRFVAGTMMATPVEMTLEQACKITGVTNKTMSKKISDEGYTASAIKTWVLEEVTQRCMTMNVSEEYIAKHFDLTRTELRASLKRRNCDNPFMYSPEQKALLARRWTHIQGINRWERSFDRRVSTELKKVVKDSKYIVPGAPVA